MTGEPVNDLIPDTQQVIADDLYCIRCGYNLRTLAVESICPECALPVSESILSGGEVGWLSKIQRGLTWLITGSSISLFVACVWLLPMLALTPSISNMTLFTLFSCMGLIPVVAAGLMARGVYLVTSKSPYRSRSVLPALGFVARATIVLLLVTIILETSIYKGWLGLNKIGPGFGVKSFVPIALSAILGLLHNLGQCFIALYLARLLATRRTSIGVWLLVCITMSAAVLVSWEYGAYLSIRSCLQIMKGAARSPSSMWFYKVNLLLQLVQLIVFIVLYARCRSPISRIVSSRLHSGPVVRYNLPNETAAI